MSSKPLLLAALVALSLGLVACGDSGSDSTSSGAETTPPASEEPAATAEPTENEGEAEAPPPSGEGEKLERSVKVEIANFEYNPDPVRVAAGGKVIWLNQDSAPHTATADDGSFDTGTIDEGKLKSETFKTPGTFTYHCEIHPQMHGTIEVVED
jgi:plastocyanin